MEVLKSRVGTAGSQSKSLTLSQWLEMSEFINFGDERVLFVGIYGDIFSVLALLWIGNGCCFHVSIKDPLSVGFHSSCCTMFFRYDSVSFTIDDHILMKS